MFSVLCVVPQIFAWDFMASCTFPSQVLPSLRGRTLAAPAMLNAHAIGLYLLSIVYSVKCDQDASICLSPSMVVSPLPSPHNGSVTGNVTFAVGSTGRDTLTVGTTGNVIFPVGSSGIAVEVGGGVISGGGPPKSHGWRPVLGVGLKSSLH